MALGSEFCDCLSGSWPASSVDLQEGILDMRMEYIQWIDPYVLDRPWNNLEELDEKTERDMECKTIGFVAKETDEIVVLAQGYTLKQDSNEVEEWGHCWVLPKICITDRKELCVYEGVSFTTIVDKELNGDSASVEDVFEHPSVTDTLESR